MRLDPELARVLDWGEPGVLLSGGPDLDGWETPAFRAVRVSWTALRVVRWGPRRVKLTFVDRRIRQSREVKPPRSAGARWASHARAFAEAVAARTEAELWEEQGRAFEGDWEGGPRIAWRGDVLRLPVERERHYQTVVGELLSGSAPWPHTDIHWREVEHATPDDLWPVVALSWRERGHTRVAFLGREDDADWGEQIEALVAELEQRRPGSVRRMGWLARPDQRFVRSERWPTDARPEGGYRTSARAEEIVAHREPTRFGRLADAIRRWIASSSLPEPGPERPRLAPIEVVLTATDLVARVAGGDVFRIPRAALVRREGERWLFGRRAWLYLDPREGCPVEAALEAQLAR